MEKKLKVGLFIDTWYPMVDGVIMVVDNYARRLAEFCDVTVFTLKPRGKCDKTYPYKVVQCKKMRVFGLDYDLPIPKMDGKFKKALKEANLDIVHIHSPFSIGSIGVEYAKKHKIPAIATLHSQYKQDFFKATKSKPITNILLKNIMKVFNKCDLALAVNEFTKNLYINDYKLKIDTQVLNNATDIEPLENIEEAKQTINKKFGFKEDDKILLYVGRINKLKGIDFLLEALSLLKVDYKMLFVGAGEELDFFKRKVGKLNLKQNVIFAGKIMDRQVLKAIYARADLFVFPSHYDTDGIVKFEAASQSTPSIFIENTGAASQIVDNKTGFIAENDIEKFAEKLEKILKDRPLLESVGKNAFEKLYRTWDECVKEVHQIYLRQIQNKKRIV